MYHSLQLWIKYITVIPITTVVNSFIYSDVKHWYFIPTVRSLDSRQLLDHDINIPPFQLREINHKERHSQLMVYECTYLIYICGLHDCCCSFNRPQSGQKPNWARNVRTAFYRCRFSEQDWTCWRITSRIFLWLCGVRTSSSDVRRHSKLNPVVCGGWIYKKLSCAAGMPWFQVWMVAVSTNQNIRRNQSRKYTQLPYASRACNAYQG